MTRVLVLTLVTVAALGLVVVIAWNPDLWEPWLQAQGIARDTPLFNGGLKLGLAVVVGVPLAALIHAIGQLGSDRTQRDIHGQTVLRLKAGTRWFTVFACLCLAALFFVYPAIDPAAPYPWAFQAAGLLCLFCIPVMLTAKVVFDATTISVSNSVGGRSVHTWADLVDMKEMPELKCWLLTFRTGKKAMISYRYAGLATLRAMAERKLEERAGTGGGRPGRG